MVTDSLAAFVVFAGLGRALKDKAAAADGDPAGSGRPQLLKDGF